MNLRRDKVLAAKNKSINELESELASFKAQIIELESDVNFGSILLPFARSHVEFLTSYIDHRKNSLFEIIN